MTESLSQESNPNTDRVEENDISIVKDIDACTHYCQIANTTMQNFLKLDASSLDDTMRLALTMGIRHLQRTSCDALIKTLRMIVIDIDGVTTKNLESALQALSEPNDRRPALVGSQAEQHMLLTRSLSLTAAIPVIPTDLDFEWKERTKAVRAHLRTTEVLLAELGRIRKWALATLKSGDAA